MKIESLDNISNEVLDEIVRKYGDNPNYRVLDDRKKISFGKPREYFLFSNYKGRGEMEWTFIWIGNNLWQFSYVNTLCKSEAKWKDPLIILNEELN